ncbi:MAG: hypothetical protein WCH43_11685 [Verrucomicrobiota bacterium]
MPSPLNPLDWIKSAQDWFSKTENPLAYAFTGSNPVLPTPLQTASTEDPKEICIKPGHAESLNRCRQN